MVHIRCIIFVLMSSGLDRTNGWNNNNNNCEYKNRGQCMKFQDRVISKWLFVAIFDRNKVDNPMVNDIGVNG